MKIRLVNIKWMDKDGDVLSDEEVSRSGLPVNWTLEMDVPEIMPHDRLWRLCCNELEREVGCDVVEVYDMTIFRNEQDRTDEGLGTWTTTKGLQAHGPRMLWLRGEYCDTLVNVERINAMLVYKSKPDEGLLYMGGDQSPIRVSRDDMERLEAVCDVLETNDESEVQE